jgi:hypothetical protein
MTIIERTLSCGLCSENTTIVAGDWNKHQAPAIDDWTEEHRQKVHPDLDGDLTTSLDPNPMRDR